MYEIGDKFDFKAETFALWSKRHYQDEWELVDIYPTLGKARRKIGSYKRYYKNLHWSSDFKFRPSVEFVVVNNNQLVADYQKIVEVFIDEKKGKL